MKKISTKLTLAMLSVTVAVLAFVGAALMINITLDYFSSFGREMELVFEDGRFTEIYDGFSGDTDALADYLENALLSFQTPRDYYILKDGNVVKSSRTGGSLKMTDNLRRVLDGGYSRDGKLTSDALDFALDMGGGYTAYVLDGKQALALRLRDIALLFLQALVIGIVLAAALSFIISKRLTHSIKKLEDGAQRMSRGEFTQVEVKTRDEVGGLCRVFNEMSEQIQSDFEQFERAESAQREFVANVSHELKTPLTVIKSYAQTLNSMELDADTRKKFLKTIDGETDRMSEIVEQLLYISKLEQPPAKLIRLDLKELCRQAADALLLESGKKGVTVRVEGEGFVRSDRERVTTIIYNLLTNAIKYSDEGGLVTVTVTGGDKPSVSVVDNGIGIPPEDIGRVFERFYRTDKARGRKTGGTGLGLAIAKESADSLGARLTAASTPGVRTEFLLEFSYD